MFESLNHWVDQQLDPLFTNLAPYQWMARPLLYFLLAIIAGIILFLLAGGLRRKMHALETERLNKITEREITNPPP